MLGILWFLLLVVLGSCSGNEQESAKLLQESEGIRDTRCLSRNITKDELSAFVFDRELTVILDKVDWAGNFEFGYREASGEEVVGISYAVCEESGASESALLILWAIFRDRRFHKFVDWVAPELERYHFMGTTNTRPKKLSVVENLNRAKSAVSSSAVTIADINRRLDVEDVDRDVSYVFTALVTPALLTLRARHEAEVLSNAKLRCKYWGGNATVGDSQLRVEGAYGEPLESWQDAEFAICLYGATATFGDLMPDLHYSKILIAYDEGEVAIVYANEFLPAVISK